MTDQTRSVDTDPAVAALDRIMDVVKSTRGRWDVGTHVDIEVGRIERAVRAERETIAASIRKEARRAR